ncbi:hypothetical protein ACG7TL_006887 [Trametes sanguinea]
MPLDTAQLPLHLSLFSYHDHLPAKPVMNSMLYPSPQRTSMYPSQDGVHSGSYQEPNATFSPWAHPPPTWPITGLNALNRAMRELPYASKPSYYSRHTGSSLNGLDTSGDDVFDPSEMRGRQPWPIGASSGPRSTSFDPHCSPSRTPQFPPPQPLGVARINGQTRGGAGPHNRTGPRCASAPPGLHRQPLGVLQETDERNEAGVEILRPGAPPPPAIRGHSPSDCANDPLCATHRKRPVRDRHPVSRPEHLANPHKRRPLALKERRPQSGNGTCDDLDCMSRSCADCAYLRSRGGVLHTKIARRGVEDKLISLDFTSRYAEDTLALLRFRAVRQVRRTML